MLAKMGTPKGVSRDAVEQRAIRLVASRHPRAYKQYVEAEMAKEELIPLVRGGVVKFPHGTQQARIRHRKHGEEMCVACIAFDEERYGRGKCMICEQEFVKRAVKNTLCDDECRFIWNGYVRYHLNWVRSRVYHARAVMRNPKAYGEIQERSARRLLKEYKATGTVERKRVLQHYPAKAMEIAERKGIDIDAVVDRLEMEAA